jgi:hypothetical protein
MSAQRRCLGFFSALGAEGLAFERALRELGNWDDIPAPALDLSFVANRMQELEA